MIPFDLAQFDDIKDVGRTAVAIGTVAKSYLGKAGVERDAASLLLSRVYMRYGLFSCSNYLYEDPLGKIQALNSILSWSGQRFNWEVMPTLSRSVSHSYFCSEDLLDFCAEHWTSTSYVRGAEISAS